MKTIYAVVSTKEHSKAKKGLVIILFIPLTNTKPIFTY